MNQPESSIYTERKVIVGVMIGGLFAGAYYFWRTLRALGMTRQALFVPAGVASLGILILATTFIPALDRIPNAAYWGIQLGATYVFYRGYLTVPVAAHLETGKSTYGWTNTLTIAVISLVITVGAMLAIAYSSGGFDGPTIRYYGRLKHEIVFDQKNITTGEVDALGNSLQSAGYFDNELQKTIDAAKEGNSYVLTLYCNDGARDPAFADLVRELRSAVQKSFATNPVIIDLVIGTPDNRIARIQ
jgi:hypothetical protein